MSVNRSHLPPRMLLAEDWKDYAACAECDPELFFPSDGDKHCGRIAKYVCRQCPVQAECLEYALRSSRREYGIWGGTTTKERDLLRQQRRRERTQA